MSARALVTGRLLRWARERDGISAERAAEMLNVSTERLSAWEDESQRPTLNQVQTLAQRLNIPLGYLFMSEPPIETIPLPDLRTVAGAPPREPSPDLLWTLRDAMAKQEWYREYLEKENAEPASFIGRFASGNDPLDIARSIHTAFGINDEMRGRAQTWEQFITFFVRQIEAQRVLVLRNGIVGNNTHRTLDVSEFRGFAISDELAPLIFINTKDARVAQVFTLAHELAHLLIGQSGISNPNYRRKSDSQSNDVEQLCNRVAAEVLVPSDDFLTRWDESRETSRNLDVLSRRYKVSRFVVLRQAYDLGKLDDESYWARYEELLSGSGRGDGEPGGNFYTNLLARNSKSLTTALLSSLAEGSVSYREAARLLNVKVGSVDSIAEHLS